MKDTYGTVITVPAEVRATGCTVIAMTPPASDDEIEAAMAPASTHKDRPACYGEDPDLWFPVAGTNSDYAVRICNGCPLRQPCLEFALDRPWLLGIWGGLHEFERHRLLRNREAA